MISNKVFAVIHVLGCFFASEPYKKRVSKIRDLSDDGMSILDGSALYMHVGLANRERINVIRFEVTKTVVDEAVCGFIRAHRVKDVLDRRVFRKTPVVLSDGRCCHLFPVRSKPGR